MVSFGLLSFSLTFTLTFFHLKKNIVHIYRANENRTHVFSSFGSFFVGCIHHKIDNQTELLQLYNFGIDSKQKS